MFAVCGISNPSQVANQASLPYAGGVTTGISVIVRG